jgi:thiosulfate/3-mercaptopyruvate sulfurtransferase
MTYQTIISTETLAANLDREGWRVMDCRFALSDTGLGRREYQQCHIPGAIYAHLDEDMSGEMIPGQTGRHPLPEIDRLAETFSRWGIDDTVQVVAYDSFNGAFSARLWWLLRWLGHNQVAILDGGWPRWVAEGRPTTTDVPQPVARSFAPRPRPELVVDVATVTQIGSDPAYRLVDSRAPERYRGETEPIDPIAGHIPGAISHFYMNNMNEADGTFLPSDRIKTQLKLKLGDIAAAQTVYYCGSGVTGAHNVFTQMLAGLGEAGLYAGSWSEWITDPERPIALGNEEK